MAHTVWQIEQVARAPIPATYDYDEGVYAATADAFARGDRLYQDVFLSQPPVLIVALRGMFHVFGATLAAARGTIVLSSTIWLLAVVTVLGARGYPGGGALAVCLLLGRSAFLVKAHTVEMELPSEALACAALALAALGTRRSGGIWWGAAGAAAVLAAMTKLTAVTGVIPLVGAMLGGRREGLARRWGGAAAGGILALGALLPIVGAAGFRDQVFGFHLVLARAVHQAALGHAISIAQFLAGEWPLSAAAGLGIWWSARSGGWLERALIVWLIADCAGLIALTPLWEHHLPILYSPLVLLAGLALDRVTDRVPALSPAVRAGAGIAAIVAGSVYLMRGLSATPQAESSAELRRVVTHLTDALPSNGEVLTDDPMVAFLAHRPVAAKLIDTSLTRIWVGEISEARLTSVLRDEQTDAVAFWRGTFRRYFPRLEPTAATLFPLEVSAGGGRVVWLKRPRLSRGP